MLKSSISHALNKAINRYIQLDPESHLALQKLEGKRIAVELRPFNVTYYGEFRDQSIQLSTESLHDAPDVILRGSPLRLLATVCSKSNRHQFFADDIEMEGQAEIGQQIIDLFDHLQIDWEEQLAKITGDAPAYHLGNLFRKTKSWLRNSNESITASINDYIHEEAQWLPTREALQDFFNDIDTIRMDTDRIEAKLQQLKSQYHH